MLVNIGNKTISFKVVYYGAALSGKTTNLRYIAKKTSDVVENASEMLSLETRGERTLYFDTVQLALGEIAGFKVKFNLYTTPGQMTYITKRRLVLSGTDAVVFVMDSQLSRQRDNVQSWYSLERQLFEIKKSKKNLPIVMQLNKRDMPYIAPVKQLLKSVRAEKVPYVEANAEAGAGVFATLDWVVGHLVKGAIAELGSPQQRSA